MTTEVTEQMVAAAHRQLPGISNRMRVRAAVEAALEHAPTGRIEAPVTVRLRLQVDEEQLRTDAAAVLAEHEQNLPMPQRRLPNFDAITDEEMQAVVEELERARRQPHLLPPAAAWEPHVTADGLEGPGVTDAIGQSPVTVTEPRVLAGITEIATRLQVGRPTVAGWVKNAAANGMPDPIAVLAAGPVYDLEAVAAWHSAWKGVGSTIGVNDGRR